VGQAPGLRPCLRGSPRPTSWSEIAPFANKGGLASEIAADRGPASQWRTEARAGARYPETHFVTVDAVPLQVEARAAYPRLVSDIRDDPQDRSR